MIQTLIRPEHLPALEADPKLARGVLRIAADIGKLERHERSIEWPDAYDVACDYFEKHPTQIKSAWFECGTHRYGYLFKYLTRSGSPIGDGPGLCGCPSAIKTGYGTDLPRLTKAVRKIEGLPTTMELESADWLIRPPFRLSAFAEAQRLADTMLGRKQPEVPT